MKILSVCTSDRGGGAERSAWLHFEGYRRRGHESWLAVGEKKSSDEGVVPLHGSPWVDYRPYGRASFRLGLGLTQGIDRALGFEDFRHPYSHHLLELVGTRPDVVHLHNLHGGFFDLRVVPRLSAQVPVFLSTHDLWGLTGHCAHPADCPRWRTGCGACPDLEAPPRVSRDATRFNHRRKADIWRRSRLRVIAPCEWIRRQLAASILAPAIEEVRVIPTGTDLACFAPGSREAARRLLGISDDAEVVLLVSNLGLANPYKDGATALAAARRLAALRAGSDLHVLVVGGERGVEQRDGYTLHGAGYVSDPEEMARYYQAADVLLHASRTDLLPLVLIEALACELPVVATAVGGVSEVVEEGVTGRLFAAGDAEQAARALASCLEHPAEAAALAARGGRLVREHYDREETVDRTLAWFEEAAAADGRRTDRAPGTTVHYGPRGALRARTIRALRERPRLFRMARGLDQLPFRATQLAVRGLGLAPRIGQLVQHAPRPLAIPERYGAAAAEPLALPPLISLVTPSLDQGRFLERTLASVLDQGYPALEYVVKDGGSTDGLTPGILATYGDRLHHVESGPDGGQAAAINRGFEHTSGEIMAWLNADDLLLPGALGYVARHFVANPDVDVVYGHRILIDENDAEVGRWILPEHDAEVLRWVDFVPQETLFWRRRAWEKVGSRLDESFRFALDWDFLLRLSRADLRIVRLPRFLGGFRVHAAQKTTALSALGQEEMDRLRRRELGFTPAPDRVHFELWRYYLEHLRLHASFRLGISRF